MTASTESRLTPGQRLTRGLAHTAAGPVDITRGALGLTAHSVAATAAAIGQRYRDGQLRKDIERELAAAQEVVGRELGAAHDVIAGLPEAFQSARADRHRSKKPWIIVGATVAGLTLGGAAFAVVRRNRKPEPSSALPPSVHIDPKP